jgi:hypothetical protein
VIVAVLEDLPDPWGAYFDAHPGCDVPQFPVVWRWFLENHAADARRLVAALNPVVKT